MLKKKINLDKTLILYVSIFAIISLISIYSASMYLSKTLGNLVLKQAMWYAVGIIFIFIIYKLKISFFIKISPYIYLFNRTVRINTRDGEVVAKIVSRVGDHILTSTNKKILLSDIISISEN